MNIKKEVEAAFRSVEPIETTLRKRFRTTRHTWEKVLTAREKLSPANQLFRGRIASQAADMLCKHISMLRKVEQEGEDI